MKPVFVLVAGLPGSGKTTRAKRLERELAAFRLSPDDWMDAFAINLHDSDRRERIETFQRDLAMRLLARGQNVIIEWGTWSLAERESLRTAAKRQGAAAHLHFLHAPPETLFARLRRRGAENPPISYEAVMSWKIEHPDQDEIMLYDQFFADTF